MARLRSVPASSLGVFFFSSILLLILPSCGGSGSPGGGGGGNPPATPSGLTVTAGNAQVSLSWNSSSGATSYNVKRGLSSTGAFSNIASPATTGYTDTTVTNGTTYYYVVSAVNAHGESGNSAQASGTPNAPATNIQAMIDVLADRHAISPYVYGGAYPKDAATVTDSGLSVVRWGGNATSQYNWKTQTSNSAADWYFTDYTYTELGESDSVKFVQKANAAGSNPLMTMVMLDWVSRGDPANSTDNGQLYSFSVAKYGAQCKVRPDNSDAGNGQNPGCTANITGNDLNDADVPIFDDNSSPCPPSAKGACVYRKDWATALASAFGSSPHFYDMDNEVDIWGGTHHNVHPNGSAYNELRDTYIRVARGLKTWDPAAIRLGPVSCCWWFYWNGADGNDKGSHAGIDFLPWWLNEVYWQDQIAGSRSLDVFDLHAYPDGPDTSTFTQVQKQALATRIYRDYWDPIYVSESGTINQNWATSIQPNKTIPFRIPRVRAMANVIYPGTPIAFTEWSAAFAGDSDFSTALGDADAYGLLGRERVYLASRWLAPDPANSNYQALKLYTNYDGAHHGFGTTSVLAAHSGDPNLFSVYAALNAAGNVLTIVAVNKDPGNAAQVSFTTNGFTASNFTTYTLSQSSPNAIVAGSSQAWNGTLTFAPYTATLVVVSGSQATPPAAAWDLNPDTIMVPANGTVTLNPVITGGSGTVNIFNAAFNSFEGTSACAGASIDITNAVVQSTKNAVLTVNAGSTPGFCHFTVQGRDGTATQSQDGWVVVGNPAATLAKTSGDGQIGTKGSTLPTPLKISLNAGQSGGSAGGASILFTASAGSLNASGNKVIAVTDSNGVASVTLTLPASAQTVTVTAEGPYGLGHPMATFAETAQ